MYLNIENTCLSFLLIKYLYIAGNELNYQYSNPYLRVLNYLINNFLVTLNNFAIQLTNLLYLSVTQLPN